MKHIVIIKSRINRVGGAEKYARHLADAFLQQHTKVTLLTSGAVTPIENIDIFSTKGRHLTSVQNIRHFDRFCTETLKQLKPDIILSLDRNSHQTHLRASNGVHAAYLSYRKQSDSFLKNLSFKLNPLHKTLLALERKAFTDPDLQTLIVNSNLVKDEVLAHYPVQAQKIKVVHNGVEWNMQQEAFSMWPSQKNAIAHSYQLDPKLFHFLFLGHNFRRKGLIPLLRSLALLNRRDYHLSIVGKDKDLAFFKNLVKKLNLEKQISFFGEQANTTPFLQIADCVVIPSYYDPFANVTLEALAMGLFVITSKTNGGHEVLQPHSGAVIETLSSPESLQTCLEMALAHPKTNDLAQAIRQSVQHLDFSKQLNTITQLCLS
jgi:UDP-glucose:(heptosyl)LPS alpha-1,3-glucosyltransferase